MSNLNSKTNLDKFIKENPPNALYIMKVMVINFYLNEKK